MHLFIFCARRNFSKKFLVVSKNIDCIMANLFNGVDGAGKTEIGVPGVPGVGIELFGLGEKKSIIVFELDGVLDGVLELDGVFDIVLKFKC